MASAAQQGRAVDHPYERRFPQFTPEFELLLACCAPLPDRSEHVECGLTHGCDFNKFIRLAEEHRVIPQVYRSLAHSELLSFREVSVLCATYEQNTQRALWLTSELVRVLAHLRDEGIKALPYKGPTLAQRLYGEVAGRQFEDLDILISPQDVGAGKEALMQLGYKPGITLSAREERMFIASGYEYAFEGVADPHALELKWRILPRFYSIDFNTEILFERAEKVSLVGHSFATLCADDLLLVLCVHAAKHMWDQLSWLCDIAELVRSPDIHSEIVWQDAERLGIRRIIAVSLLLAHNLLRSELPASLDEWCKHDSATRLLSKEVLFMVQTGCSYDTESVAYFNFMLRARERWADRNRFLWRLVWTPGPGEWSAIHFPERLSFLYRFVRLGRLGKRISGVHQQHASAEETPVSVVKATSST